MYSKDPYIYIHTMYIRRLFEKIKKASIDDTSSKISRIEKNRMKRVSKLHVLLESFIVKMSTYITWLN